MIRCIAWLVAILCFAVFPGPVLAQPWVYNGGSASVDGACGPPNCPNCFPCVTGDSSGWTIRFTVTGAGDAFIEVRVPDVAFH